MAVDILIDVKGIALDSDTGRIKFIVKAQDTIIKRVESFDEDASINNIKGESLLAGTECKTDSDCKEDPVNGLVWKCVGGQCVLRPPD